MTTTPQHHAPVGGATPRRDSPHLTVRMTARSFHWLTRRHGTPIPYAIQSLRYHRRWPNPWSGRFTQKLLRYARSDWMEQQGAIADKLAVRDRVRERVGESYLTQIFASATDPGDLDFDALPARYFLKTNHACARNLDGDLVPALGQAQVRRLLKEHLAYDLYRETGERQYRHITPRVFAEERLDLERPDAMMLRLFCFEGRPEFVIVDTKGERTDPFDAGTYLPDWTPAQFHYGQARRHMEVPRPHNLEEVVDVASALARGLPFVRVDLYWIGGRIVFSELTLTPSRGGRRITPDTFDRELGRLFTLPGRCAG